MEPSRRRAAFEEFGSLLFDEGLLSQIQEMGRRVQQVVPECVELTSPSVSKA